MSEQLLAAVVLALLLAIPLLIEKYVRQLPVAPICPSCHAIAREVQLACSLLDLFPAFGKTFIGECARCGWRGRMRWRWAPETRGNRIG